jgi:hypothetical protein
MRIIIEIEDGTVTTTTIPSTIRAETYPESFGSPAVTNRLTTATTAKVVNAGPAPVEFMDVSPGSLDYNVQDAGAAPVSSIHTLLSEEA